LICASQLFYVKDTFSIIVLLSRKMHAIRILLML